MTCEKHCAPMVMNTFSTVPIITGQVKALTLHMNSLQAAKAFRCLTARTRMKKRSKTFTEQAIPKPATTTWCLIPSRITICNQLTVYTANADGSESGETGPLYNTADFETRDKYKAFLRGNNGYSVLEGNGTGSILIIKDSYANAFIPYLVEDYASIGIVDFRYLNEKVDSLIERGGYDEILVLFSFQGFMDDMTLAAKIATP